VLLALGLVVPADGDLQVAIATLVAVGVSVPAGRRIRRWVDKRFFRSRYDAAAIVSSFADELRHTIDTDAVVALTIAVVAGAFAPESVDVWLDGGPV
jgi:predicted PurR-regulated permease PerM